MLIQASRIVLSEYAHLLDMGVGHIAERKINSILHEYAQYILGRMGVPYQKRGISVISIIIDAPQPVISALSGKLGKLEGVSTKALYSNVMENIDG